MSRSRPPRQPESAKILPEADIKSPPSQIVDPLQEQLSKKVGDLLPAGSREEILRRITTVVHSEQFSGPIAHPRHLREYEITLPGSADRIIRMAEAQQEHQINMERLVVSKEYGDRRWGMVIGAVLFVALIGCAFVLATLGNNIAAGLFLTAAAIGGIGLFINGRTDSEK